MLNENNYKSSSYFTRRSIRSFTNQTVEEWKIKALIEAFFQSQTARNQQSWELIKIDNKDLMLKLRSAHPSSKALETSQLAFIITSIKDYKTKLPSHLRIQQDLAIATHQLCLMANDLGLGSCWCAVHPNESIEPQVRQILNIPEDVVIFAIVPIGYPNEVKDPNNKSFPERLHHNGW